MNILINISSLGNISRLLTSIITMSINLEKEEGKVLEVGLKRTEILPKENMRQLRWQEELANKGEMVHIQT